MRHRCGTCTQISDIFRQISRAAATWTEEEKAQVRAELDRKLPSSKGRIN
jgi:hypothetical protein